MKRYVGTSGSSYNEWRGSFYPEKFPEKQMLGYYAERLTAVEINNTFYRMPKTSVLRSWAEQVPDGFRFIIKASRKITHFGRLNNAGDATEYLVNTTQTLGSKLGAILFQLPGNFKQDIKRLEAFLNLLPIGTRAAFEFRHQSWFDNAVYELLRIVREISGVSFQLANPHYRKLEAYATENRTVISRTILSQDKVALCMADTEDERLTDLTGTTSWGYPRLRREQYKDAELKAWLARAETLNWDEAFVFFKHEDAGAGPELAKPFIAL